MNEVLEDYSLNKREIKNKGMIQKVGIIGCGSAGQEICRHISQHGLEVVFIDLTVEKVDEILIKISQQIDEEINKWGLTKSDKRAILSRIVGSIDYNDIKDCDIIIETISIESSESSKETRKKVFKKVEAHIKKDTVITSNTSSIIISELASVLKHPERALGLHFLTPATTVKIVEVIKGVKTSNKAYEFVVRFVKMIDKKAITLNEAPGNISTRLIVPLINEACDTLIEGVATMDSIDHTMKQGFGQQFGPFELADRIGIDKVLKWMDNLYAEYGDQRFKASPLIRRLVRMNYLGKKTSKGFYKYSFGKIVGETISNIEVN